MSERFGWPAALFGIKCFMAAALALYISFSIGLERPYWAFITSFIMAQPMAGAVISKAVYRILGTLVGAAVAIIMVPPLVNAPELLTLAVAGWLGFCVFVAQLDGTPRSYMFSLAGYSACLIAFPSFDAPAGIFDLASSRVQEITIGILAGSLVHAAILPGSVATMVLNRVAAILRDAERWTRDAIAAEPVEGLAAERRRLAQDVTELHQLSTHLPYDLSRRVPRVRTVRALQDQLSLLLPLGAAVDDRVKMLKAAGGGAVRPEAAALIADVQHWVEHPETDMGERGASAAALIDRCKALEPPNRPDMDWADMLRLSLYARLADLIAAHRDCRDLYDQMTSYGRAPVNARVAQLLEGWRFREVHRDYEGAFRGAFNAFVTLVAACALWIGSGWRDGAGAAMLAGVFLAVYAAQDNPQAPLKGWMTGTILASSLGALYGYAIMPRLDGFVMLMAAFAPPLILLGSAMASPALAAYAMPMLLGLGSPALLASSYIGDFPTFLNGNLAQLTGIWFAAVMAGILQPAGSRNMVRRTIRAGWRDIAQRANLMERPNLRRWINRMLDRVALLAPRLAAMEQDAGKPIYDALRDLRTGIGIGELRELRMDLPPGERAPLTRVLEGVGDYYRGLDPDAPAPAQPALLHDIDGAITELSAHPDPRIRRDAMLGLVALRRNLFADDIWYRRAAA
ncbi:FUSC family protein [Sphingobium cloacae]|uniref:Fusaric acid resistance protein n=1 Tax=Sphingobium cloacae TaxID=120107 RepID=A0A1E1F5D7_9SPHN|nr:FUSC family protein [Sphingobium cloacae]BAV65728.1 fusaric acid resistance protein [Sphingobium cloacae]